MSAVAVADWVVGAVMEEVEREVDVREVEGMAPRNTGRQTKEAI